jgi:hypothetical protein
MYLLIHSRTSVPKRSTKSEFQASENILLMQLNSEFPYAGAPDLFQRIHAAATHALQDQDITAKSTVTINS